MGFGVLGLVLLALCVPAIFKAYATAELVASLKTSVDTIKESGATKAENKATQDSVNSLKASVSELSTRVTGLEGLVTAASKKLNTVESLTTLQSTAVSEIKQAVNKLDLASQGRLYASTTLIRDLSDPVKLDIGSVFTVETADALAYFRSTEKKVQVRSASLAQGDAVPTDFTVDASVRDDYVLVMKIWAKNPDVLFNAASEGQLSVDLVFAERSSRVK